MFSAFLFLYFNRADSSPDPVREIKSEFHRKTLAEAKRKILIGIIAKILFVWQSKYLGKIALDSNLFVKKVAAKEIFGSNLFLGEKTVRPAEGGTPNSLGKLGGNQWDALRASHSLGSSVSFSTKLESLLYQARTYFQNR